MINSELKPVKEGIFEVEPTPRLIGGTCSTCDKKFFPKPQVCPNCLGEVEDVALSTKGKVYTYAVLSTKAPYELPSPYAVGWVDLEEDGLRIFTLFDPETISDLSIGKEVSLRIGQIGVDNDKNPCLRYYFTVPDGGEQ